MINNLYFLLTSDKKILSVIKYTDISIDVAML